MRLGGVIVARIIETRRLGNPVVLEGHRRLALDKAQIFKHLVEARSVV
jgi:hypothetical protein